MINNIRVFQVDTTLNILEQSSDVFSRDEIPDQVSDFFTSHMLNSVSDKKTKNVRFRREQSEMVESFKNSYSDDFFEESSFFIADKMAKEIRFSQSFLLIVATYIYESELESETNDDSSEQTTQTISDSLFDDGEEILAVFKMEKI